MLMEWLEPSIKKRVEEVTNICEIENEQFYKDFSETFNHIRHNTSESLLNDLLKLEELFTQRLLVADTAYRLGFQDGLILTQK